MKTEILLPAAGIRMTKRKSPDSPENPKPRRLRKISEIKGK
jgi:hypothetical protein